MDVRIASSFSPITSFSTGAFVLGLAVALHPETARGRLPSDAAVDPLAAVCERGVGAGHLERVDGLDAEPDREVLVERARDPEPVRHPRDLLRPDERRQLRVDGVVGVRGRVDRSIRPR